MITKVLIAIGLSCAIPLMIAVGLVLSQRPTPVPPGGSLDFDGALANRFVPPYDDLRFERSSFTTPDGENHPVTRVRDPALTDPPVLVMVHGSGWHGQQFDRLAWGLRDVAEVWAVTLRGHGAAPERRGDVDYIGQFEDDLAHLMAEAGARPIVLLGHSSGGGLVVRFAGGPHGALIDRAILLAPFLKYNAPPTRANSGGWAHPLTRRLAGLSMLNAVGIRALNHLTVMQFAMPPEVLNGPLGRTATTAYSHRLNTSFAPRNDYLADVSRLPPFVLIAGAKDEAFDAPLFEKTMTPVTDNGQFTIVPGVGHLDIVDAPETETAIRDMLRDL